MKSIRYSEHRSEYRRNKAGTGGTRPDHERRVVKRHLDLFDLCVWAYRDQMVDKVTGKGLFEGEAAASGVEPHETSGCGCAVIERIGAVGGRIDGGAWKSLTNRVHPDAVAVADRVKHQAVAFFARQAEAPEWPASTPRAWPEVADRQRDAGWGRIDLTVYRHAEEWRALCGVSGRLVDYRILEAGRWAEEESYWEWSRRERRHVQRTRVKEVHPIPYCPINWSPSVEWIMAQQGTYRAWHDAMSDLQRALADVALRDHVVTGFAYPRYW